MKIPWAHTIVRTISFKLQAAHVHILLFCGISKSTQSVPLEDFLEHYYPVSTQSFVKFGLWSIEMLFANLTIFLAYHQP